MNDTQVICDDRTGHMPGLVVPAFKTKREEVRWKVRHLNLCAFDRETRQAAAADPAIVWDAEARQYRFRRRSDPPRPDGVVQYLDPANAANATPAPPEGVGAIKVPDRPTSRPASANDVRSMTKIAKDSGHD